MRAGRAGANGFTAPVLKHRTTVAVLVALTARGAGEAIPCQAAGQVRLKRELLECWMLPLESHSRGEVLARRLRCYNTYHTAVGCERAVYLTGLDDTPSVGVASVIRIDAV